ncbi:MAG: hypothetical protein A2017_20645 [Lentisphaerae bacterium GWF2_44_16]|nr:MAG: hypothetical protein A2017_20645 [Lentisphaerae bacterium GWF2_44_16]
MNNLYQTGSQIGDVFSLGINSAFFDQPRNIIKDSFCFKDTLEGNFRNFDTSSSEKTWTNPISSSENTRIFELNANDNTFTSVNDSTGNDDMYKDQFSESHTDDISDNSSRDNAEYLEKMKKSEDKQELGDTEKHEKIKENIDENKNDVKSEMTQVIQADKADQSLQVQEEKNKKTAGKSAENITNPAKNNTSLLERLLKISGDHENTAEKSKNAGTSSQKNNLKTKNQQNIQHTENESAKSSAMAENSDLRKTAKNEGKSETKAADAKLDMASRLESETGVKINKLTYENNSSTENGSDGKSKNEAEMGLLKNLAHNSTRPILKKETLEETDHQDGRSSFKEITQEAKNSLKAENASAKTANAFDAKTKTELNESGSLKSSNNNVNNEKLLQHQDSTNNIQNASAKSAMSAQQQTSTSATVSNIFLLQEIMSRIQSAVKADSFEANPKLSMEFESNTLGLMHMSIHQKGSILNVSLETSSDSTKDNLMGQRDELARQMKNLGYSEVNVDISSNKEKKENSSGKQSSGNADIDNVKLAGNDKIDMSRILAF